MENFVYEYPTKVCFGKGAAKAHLPGILSACGPNVLLAYGGGSIKKNGVYEELLEILKAAGKTVTEFAGIMSNPTWVKVQEGAQMARDCKADLVLAGAAAASSTAAKSSAPRRSPARNCGIWRWFSTRRRPCPPSLWGRWSPPRAPGRR